MAKSIASALCQTNRPSIHSRPQQSKGFPGWHPPPRPRRKSPPWAANPVPRDALKSGAGAWHKTQAAQPTTDCPPSRHCPDRFVSTPSGGLKDIKLPELTALDTLLSSSSFRQLSVILCRGCLSSSTSHSFPSF